MSIKVTIPNSETAVEPKKGLYSGETKDGEAEGVGKEILPMWLVQCSYH